nr:ribonuclease H-like domain-containing protein [Tanacetum cinerariifolium]
MNLFCKKQGIKREFSVSRIPQRNEVSKRKNRTLIEAARTMLADLKLPTTFWAKAVNTACYVRVLVIKPHNKNPYELFHGRTLSLSFMIPFGYLVIILNTLDHLGSGPTWLFDIDTLTKSINYKPVVVGNQSNGSVGKSKVETVLDKDYILLPLWTQDPLFSSSYKDSPGDGFKPSEEEEKKDVEDPGNEDNEVLSTKEPGVNQEKYSNVNNTNNINTVSPTANVVGIKDNDVDKNIVYGCADDPNMPILEMIVYLDDDEDVGAEADMTNLDTNIPISPIPSTRIHKGHPVEQIIRDIHSAPQTRRMTKSVTDHDLLNGKRAIGTKWIYKNKKDERGIVVRNKARLVAQGYTQEEGIKYDEIFAPVARIEAIRLFLAYSSFNDFVVYQIDVKSAFLYGKIKEEVYICQPLWFKDPDFPNRVNKIIDFLNANPIKYVLTVNPTFYTSCIEEFWATAMTKNINGEAHIHTKVDGKKVIISKAIIKRDLKFKDEGGVDCLSNEVIFEQLPLMGCENLSQKLTFYKALFSQQWKFLIHIIMQFLSAKTTTCNEFSSTMASAIICLATNQKFNFSKYIFDSMVKHLHSGTKFLMYPRFVQGFLDKQVDGTSKHNAIYVIPSHTKKVFSNMKRVGKDFSRRHTLIPNYDSASTRRIRKQKPRKTKRKDTKLPQTSVPTEVVADEAVYEEMYDNMERAATTVTSLNAEQDRGIISKTQITATLNKPSFIRTSSGSGPRRQETMRDVAAQTRSERVSKFSNDSPLSRVNTLRSGEDRLQLKELMELCIKMSERVLNLETTKTTKAKENSNQGRYNDQEIFDIRVLDDEEIVVEKAVVVKEVDAAQDQVSVATTTTKYLTVDDITLAKALKALKTSKLKIRGIVVRDHEELRKKGKMVEPKMPLKKKAQISLDEELAFKLHAEQEEERIAREKALEANIVVKDRAEGSKIRIEESSNRAREDIQQESTKKQKVDDDQEAAELKRCLEIVHDDKDNVTIDATLLSSKSPTIIDYKIHKEGRKAKARFEKEQLVDDLDCYLLHTLKTMFEHHVEDSVWQNQQRLAKVKN